MKPIFTIHAGEFIVGEYIERNFSELNVWIPSKDTGIDLLVSDPTNSKCVSLQVKFSKDFSLKGNFSDAIDASGWWNLDANKIDSSKADLWVFVLFSFARKNNPHFVVIEPQEILGRFKDLGRKEKRIHCYICVTKDGKCWETRGLNRLETGSIDTRDCDDSPRDLTKYLNWNLLHAKLQSISSRQ